MADDAATVDVTKEKTTTTRAPAPPRAQSFEDFLKSTGLPSSSDVEKRQTELFEKHKAAEQPLVTASEDMLKQMKSLDEEIGKIKPPESPKFEDLPKPPDTQLRDPIQGLGNIASVLAIFGSLRTRQPLTTALNAAAASMKAFHEGDVERANLERQKWRDEMEKGLRQNQQEMQKYMTALQEANFDMNKAQSRMRVIAVESQHNSMLAAIEAGDYQAQSKIIDAGLKAGTEGAKLYIQEQMRMAQLSAMKELTKLRFGMGGDPNKDPGLRSARSAMAASGMPLSLIVPGWGAASIPERRQAQEDGLKLIQQQLGMTPQEAGYEMARRDLAYNGIKGSVSQLQKMRGATDQAMQSMEFNAKQAEKEMEKLPSSNFLPLFNAIMRGEEKWTGDPAYTRLYGYMYTAVLDWQRIMQGAQASVAQLHEGARQDALRFANADWTTPKVWKEGVVPLMKADSTNRLENFDNAIAGTLEQVGKQRKRAGEEEPPPGTSDADFDAIMNMYPPGGASTIDFNKLPQ